MTPDRSAELIQSGTRHIRVQKIVGLALMAISLPPTLFVLMYAVEEKVWLHADPSHLVCLALLYLGSGNGFVLGLVVLLAGLGDRELLNNSEARKGALIRLVGANLFLLAFAFVGLFEEGAFDSYMESWIILLLAVVFVIIARAGLILFRKGWKYDAIPAALLIERDTRRPVVYIRSFNIDDRIAPAFNWTAVFSVEQELAIIMNRVGPVIAIGRPGELLPQLGAARLYVDDDKWKATITDLMKRARLVVVVAGPTANLRWEIDQAVTLLSHRQLIFVVPPGDAASAFEKDIEQIFGKPTIVDPQPQRTVLWWLARLLNRQDQGKIIYFGADSNPYAECMQYALSWEGLVLSPYRPYRDTLNASCRRAFKQLELPWTEQKSRTSAVLLAFFVGAFGLHQFYIGNKRRGFCYLVFCWTFVPFVLAWIDAFKLAMTDANAFGGIQSGRNELDLST